MDKIVFSQLLVHVEQNFLHNPFQSAYRKGQSTESALLKIIISDLLLGFDDDTVSFLASLDLSLDSTVLAFMMLLSPSFALWS